MPYYDVYFLLVNIYVDVDKLCMTGKYYLAGKINQHGGKYNCIKTPVAN